MKENVKIEITGIHKVDGETDKISNSFDGVCKFANGKHFILYKEQTEDGEIKTIIKVADDYVDISKKGIQQSNMNFIAGELTKSTIKTMYGVMNIDIYTKKLNIFIKDDFLKIVLNYELKMDESILNSCEMTIVVS